MSETCACRTYQWWNNCEHVALRAMYKAFDKGLNAKLTVAENAALNQTRDAIAQAGKEEGILRQHLLVSTHVLRHTAATRLLDAGIDIYSVSRHLGHSNVSTTDRYLHNRADLTAAFERMSA